MIEVRFIFEEVLFHKIGFESRMQQLKMATYFDEILGDLLLKVQAFMMKITCSISFTVLQLNQNHI